MVGVLGDMELLDRPEVKPEEMVVGPRVGIDYALLEGADALWRFVVAGNLCISAPKNTLQLASCSTKLLRYQNFKVIFFLEGFLTLV